MARLRIDVALPILNEQASLERSVRTLTGVTTELDGYDWAFTIVDNGSHDGSWRIAQEIAGARPDVRAIRLDERGRGRALRSAWTSSSADVVAYMDIDLSTSLDCLPDLVNPIAVDRADVVVGSRLLKSSEVRRGVKREVISHTYNWIARNALGYSIRDAQCGFKAVNRRVVESVVPQIEDHGWFFDTELLIRASRMGCRIEEIPVRWVEDVDSRVRIVRTVVDDLRGIARLARWRRLPSDESQWAVSVGPEPRSGSASY